MSVNFCLAKIKPFPTPRAPFTTRRALFVANFTAIPNVLVSAKTLAIWFLTSLISASVN